MKYPPFLLLLLAVGAGCDPAAEAAPVRSLQGGTASVEELAEQVVAGLVAGDSALLESLRLSEHEHNELLWPEFPAARQHPPFPVDLAWENIQIRNAGALYDLLPRFRGRALRVRGVVCPGREDYPSFRAVRECSIRVVEEGAGELEIRPFRSVVVWGGRHKIVRYSE